MFRSIIMAAGIVLFAAVPGFCFELQLQPLFNGLGYDTDVTIDEIVGDVFFQIQPDEIRVLEQISGFELSSAIGWYTENSSNNWLVGGDNTALPKTVQMPLIDEVFGINLWTNYDGHNSSDYVWYSELLRNEDLKDHCKVYKTRLNGHLVAHSYLLAWEDLPDLGDADFQDIVIRLDGVQAVQGSSVPVNRPVPEPSTLAFCLVGGFAALAVRKLH